MTEFQKWIEGVAIGWCNTGLKLDESDRRAVTSFTRWLMEIGAGSALTALKPIKDAPRDGREVLCTDGKVWRVCVPKKFQPDVWEYFRDEQHAPGHTLGRKP